MERDSQYDFGASSASSADSLPINRIPMPLLAPVAGSTGGHRVGDELSETSSSGSSRGDHQQPCPAAQCPPAVETVIYTGSQGALPVVPTTKSNSRMTMSLSYHGEDTGMEDQSGGTFEFCISLTV